MGIVEQHIKMAKKHNKIIGKKYKTEIKYSAIQSKIFTNASEVKYTGNNYPILSFKNIDSSHAGISLKEKDSNLKVTILNFANYTIPGGGYLHGALAQEEVLCHQSDLYQVLTKFSQYYSWNQMNLNQNLYEHRALYTPNIVFTNLDGSFVNTLDVITCAAPCYTIAKHTNISYEKACIVLKKRMEFVKNIAEYEKVDKLILGAWGAGAFGFRGIEVAKMWHDVWRTPSPIKEIQFAVIDHLGFQNAQIFKSEFSN